MNRTTNNPRRAAFRWIMLTMIAFLAVSCNHHRNHPGYAFMADYDMYYSKPADAYSPNDALANGMSMQMPPAGSIARGEIPYPYPGKSMDEQLRAGLELVNPVPVTPESVGEGKALYQVYCMVCHGEYGDGNGYLFTSKRFPAKPTSLIEEYVSKKPDGELYHVITRGSVAGLMGPLASQVSPENRWKIIHYVRELEKK